MHPIANSIKTVGGRRHRLYRVVLVALFVYLCISRLSPWLPHITLPSTFPWTEKGEYDTVQSYPLPHHYKGRYPHVAINRTLGFQDILVVSLPERLNKRDEIIMMADATGIDIKFQDAIKWTDMKLKGLPAHDVTLRGQELACWRSHVNVWKRMIEEEIQSALIMEDDIDWHKDIKQQLEQLQGPLATLSTSFRDDNINRKSTVDKPFPGDWELLWLGACLEESWVQTSAHHHRQADANIGGNEPLLLYQDSTTSTSNYWSKRYQDVFSDYGLPLSADNSTYNRTSIFHEQVEDVSGQYRVIQKALFPVCTASYAITLSGARKMLYYATRAITRPIDHSMARLGYDDLLEAYSIVPALMGQWKIDHGWNSDISLTDDDATTGIEVNPSVGQTENVGPGSIRKHVQGAYFGEQTRLVY